MHSKLKKFDYLLRVCTSGSKFKVDKKFLKDNDCEIKWLDFKTKVWKGEADDDSDFEEDPDTQFYASVECPKEYDNEKLKKCIMKMVAQTTLLAWKAKIEEMKYYFIDEFPPAQIKIVKAKGLFNHEFWEWV